jgi:SAM-dependent methyltransferase
MVCHGELARLKPAPQHLTAFYLALSLGGTLGGMFVALAAPRLFSGYFELPLALAACAALALMVLYRDPQSPFYHARWNAPWLITVGLALAIVASLGAMVYRQRADSRLMVRNFYGVLRELEETPAHPGRGPAPRRILLNGPIQHGLQFQDETFQRQPTSYYGPRSGAGLTLNTMGEGRALRVGAIGLGVGTVAAYGRERDQYFFYEINPLVITLARRDFSYLQDSRAEIRILAGDARLTLERQAPQDFDVLLADAFSGDAIPVHLLTREAFELYFRHLKPDGVLAVHVSNSYLRLEPVVARTAATLGKAAVKIYARGSDEEGTFGSTWVLVTTNQAFLGSPVIRAAAEPLAADPQLSLWTDDYSNLAGILKWALN